MNKMEDHITDDPFGFDPEAEKEFMFDNRFWEEMSNEREDDKDEIEQRDQVLGKKSQ